MLYHASTFAALPPWQRLLLAWLGYDSAQAADTRPELLWANVPSSWGVLVLIGGVAALLYAVYWLYRREAETCPLWAKSLLAGLRSAVVLLLACVVLGPELVYLQRRTIQPTIVLARDASLSMDTSDRYNDDEVAKIVAAALHKSTKQIRAERPTRAQIVNDLLNDSDAEVLSGLAQRGNIQVVDFADQATTLTSQLGIKNSAQRTPHSALDILPPLVAAGRGTDLAGAIRRSLAIDSAAAVILFTDGQHTGKDDPRQAAREAQSRGVPLLVVGVGDPSRPRNLKLTNLYVPPQVWQDEPFEIEAVASAEGIEASEVRLELIEHQVGANDAATSGGTVVQSLQLSLPQEGSRVRAPFSHTARQPGRFIYSVRAEPVAGELTDDDNQLASAVVKALSRERIRVLLVAGAATWEYRLVQKLLARDKTILLSCWLQSLDKERPQEGTRAITHLPATRDELFSYDVIALLDPDPREFDQAWIDLVQQFVGEHSGGLLYMAGQKYSGRLLTDPRTSEFAKILPVTFGDIGALEVAALLSTTQRPWPVKAVPASADHPLIRLYPEREEVLDRWQKLPGLFWSFPATEARPAAQVLIEHSDPALRGVEGSRPLMVAGRYGSGQTLYLGFDGTWRWRTTGRQAEFFDKFWIQAIRYLADGRALEGRRRGYVQTDRDRYEIGELVTITGRLQDASYNPLVTDKLDAVVHVAGEEPQSVPLLALPNQPGGYEGTFTAEKMGVHSVRVMVPVSESESGTIETPFTVELPSVETNQVWLNKPLLVDAANLSGGRYFEIDQLDQLSAAVPDRSQTIESRSRPIPLWDQGSMLVALVGLLSVEWLLRKRFKLL